jgi:hypothetical protein
MNISRFDDLLLAARQQPQPQRLLMVFASAELPDDCTPEQRAQFASGAGGALVPGMCVDKTPDEIGDFASLVLESCQFDVNWQLVFASSLSGLQHQPPSDQQAEAALQRMVQAIKAGDLSNMIAFDRSGQATWLE